MIITEDFINQWGRGDLAPFSPELLKELHVDTETREFLTFAGLPRTASLPGNLEFTLLAIDRDSFTTNDTIHLLLEKHGRYRLLGGWQFETYFCLEEEHGRVFLIDVPSPIAGTRDKPFFLFVNSSVTQFAACLLAYRGLPKSPGADDIDDETWTGLLQKLKQELQLIDLEAMMDAESYWSACLYDLETPL